MKTVPVDTLIALSREWDTQADTAGAFAAKLLRACAYDLRKTCRLEGSATEQAATINDTGPKAPRIVSTSPTARLIDPQAVADALGAEIVSATEQGEEASDDREPFEPLVRQLRAQSSIDSSRPFAKDKSLCRRAVYAILELRTQLASLRAQLAEAQLEVEQRKVLQDQWNAAHDAERRLRWKLETQLAEAEASKASSPAHAELVRELRAAATYWQAHKWPGLSELMRRAADALGDKP